MALDACAISARWAQNPPVMTIDGKSRSAMQVLPVINPSTGEVLCPAPLATAADIDAAVAAAGRAQIDWSRRPEQERREQLLSLATHIEAHSEELTLINSMECGVPMKVARSVAVSVRYIRALAEMDIPRQLLHSDGASRVELSYQPLGVVAALTPWNAPLTLAGAKLASALLTGNTVVLKPSPFAPLATLRLGELAREVLPPGVLNVINGDSPVGQQLIAHPDVAMVSFTGSVGVGKAIMRAAAGSLKRLTLELGGNDAAIVLDDVDPALVGPELAHMAFANCGQFCMAIKRLYVARPIYDAVCDAVAAAIASKRVGHALDPQSDIGPLQNAVHYQRIVTLLSGISDQGGRCLTGGAAINRAGYFVSPTVVVDLNESSPLVCEEQFGPILPILPIDSPEEAVRLANAGRLGLGGSVWSSDVERATALAGQLEVGTAWVNQHGVLNAHYPMGGVKESGLGTEYGLAGLLQYTNSRVLNVNLDPVRRRGA